MDMINVDLWYLR